MKTEPTEFGQGNSGIIPHQLNKGSVLIVERQVIHTDAAPQAIGPYSQAIAASGKMLFVSGQIPIDPATGAIVEGGIEAQTKQVMENVQAILAAAGASFANVVKTTVFIKNMDDFSKINAVYGQYMTQEAPARGCVEVARLPKDVLVEVEAIAVL